MVIATDALPTALAVAAPRSEDVAPVSYQRKATGSPGLKPRAATVIVVPTAPWPGVAVTLGTTVNGVAASWPLVAPLDRTWCSPRYASGTVSKAKPLPEAFAVTVTSVAPPSQNSETDSPAANPLTVADTNAPTLPEVTFSLMEGR